MKACELLPGENFKLVWDRGIPSEGLIAETHNNGKIFTMTSGVVLRSKNKMFFQALRYPGLISRIKQSPELFLLRVISNNNNRLVSIFPHALVEKVKNDRP